MGSAGAASGRIAHGIRQKSEAEKVQRRVRDRVLYLTDFPMLGSPLKFDDTVFNLEKIRLLKALYKECLL